MTTFKVTTTVANNPRAKEVREYTIAALPVLLKPLAYILTDREFMSLEFTMGLAHFRIEPIAEERNNQA